MSWIPQFKYPASSGTVLTLTRDMRHWTQRQRTEGGWRESASGVAAARTIRRDYLADFVIRFTESEADNMETLVAWMQDNIATAFDFWPNAATSGTFYPSYLRAPLHGDDYAPQRNDELPSDWEVTLTLRRSTGAAWPLVWYP